MYGKSGRVGQLVFRQLHGETIVQAAEQGSRKPRSAAQRAQAERTARARQYGKAQFDDPVAKALYAARITKNCTSAYTVAVQDYLRPPAITALDASSYRGQAGDAIRVQATDDFGVVSVQVRLLAPGGALLEAGAAAPQADGSWLYLATCSGPGIPGTVVETEARDRPGNVATQRQTLGQPA